jgi:hypothetical protein
MRARSIDWSARSPVIHAAAPARARPSGSTLRTAQQPLPGVERAVESVYALARDQRFEVLAFGVDSANAPAVSALDLGPKLVGLRKQPSGIEGDDIDCEVLSEDRMGDCLILNPETGSEYDPAAYYAAPDRVAETQPPALPPAQWCPDVR